MQYYGLKTGIFRDILGVIKKCCGCLNLKIYDSKRNIVINPLTKLPLDLNTVISLFLSFSEALLEVPLRVCL